jgi:hypothetical protein
VQARLRQANAATTLDTYGHLWPDAYESTRIAVGAVIKIGVRVELCRLITLHNRRPHRSKQRLQPGHVNLKSMLGQQLTMTGTPSKLHTNDLFHPLPGDIAEGAS